MSICVSDEGGGMGMGTARDAFKYLWTSSGTRFFARVGVILVAFSPDGGGCWVLGGVC